MSDYISDTRILNSSLSDYLSPVSEDALLHIFKWLPVKSLFRFRCVCKRWKDTIDSDYFAQFHLAAQSPRLLVSYERPDEYLVLDPRTLPSFDTLPILPFEDEFEKYRLVGTLCGVVCLYGNSHIFYIWNPSIRMYAVVLLPEFIEFEWSHDAEVAPYSSFWMDPRTKHFKIIVFKLVYNFTREPFVNGVLYSSITQEWVLVPLGDRLRDHAPQVEGPPVMVGEVAYWRAWHEWMEQGKERTNTVVLSYDFARGSFDVIEMRHGKSIGYFVMLCKLQGCLSAVYGYPTEDPPYRCAVYLWREGVWVKTFGFNLLPQLSRIYWVWEEMEGRCKSVAAWDRDALVLYDATKEDCIEFKSGVENYFWGVFMAGDYVESLLFPWT